MNGQSGGFRRIPTKRRESKDPVGPRSSQVNVLQTEQQSVGDKGRLRVNGQERSGDHKRNSEPRGSPLILPRRWQNLVLA